VSVSVENGALALIGICVTLIVGISIVNEGRMRELEKKLKKIDEVEKNLEILYH
jgi:DNA-binding Lrp family transcriptional regulator